MNGPNIIYTPEEAQALYERGRAAGLAEARDDALDVVREFLDAERDYLQHIKTRLAENEEPDFGPWDRMVAAKSRLGALVGYGQVALDAAQEDGS